MTTEGQVPIIHLKHVTPITNTISRNSPKAIYVAADDSMKRTNPDLRLYFQSKITTDIVSARRTTFKGKAKSPEEIAKTMQTYKEKREANQPQGVKTSGSTFKNPDGLKAWELIDKAGCRNLTRGDAVISDKHANFLINKGKASSADVEGLGEEVRKRVFDKCQIMLEWEVKRVGVSKQPEEE